MFGDEEKYGETPSHIVKIWPRLYMFAEDMFATAQEIGVGDMERVNFRGRGR